LNIKEILYPYNPWWEDLEGAFARLPDFRRPVFDRIYRDIKLIPQIISITGPRRVGKSTIIKQVVKELIAEGVSAGDIFYYSMDDPALLRRDVNRDDFFDALMAQARDQAGGQADSIEDKAGDKLIYIFLDEIHKFENWELFLKKYYDICYPVRFIVSGSASSPIFKKSRESLLGRIKDYHMLPFSFREFVMFNNRDDREFIEVIMGVHIAGKIMFGQLTDHHIYLEKQWEGTPLISMDFRERLTNNLKKYMLDGGFPEVWTLPDAESKQAYLFDNQIQKVITEDLVLAVELRKPEALKKFFISLLENPGREINFSKLSKDLEIPRQSIEKYFPLLEMTDLVRSVEKFSKSPVRLRRGNIKCYLVDLALRNAVLRLREDILKDDTVMGMYAENLVFNAIRSIEGLLAVNYYREKNEEVDFILHLGASRYLPIEVKFRNVVNKGDLQVVERVNERYKFGSGLVVTKNWEESTAIEKSRKLIYIPLPYFLLWFD
jgi:hypothetical protein